MYGKETMNKDPLNKTIVISGGASGIGLAAVKKFLHQDFNVCVLDHNQTALDELQKQLIKDKNRLLFIACDITQSELVSKALDQCVEKFKCINAVLPAAGIVQDGYFIKIDRASRKVKSQMSQKQFAAVLDVNLTGTFNTIQQAAMRMIDNQWPGVLYLVSSINQSGQLGQLNYSSSKHALSMWPKLLVGEFHKQDVGFIRVVGIAPGYVNTPILNDLKPVVKQSLIDDIAIGRFINGKEIVSTLWHIWENKAINATTIEVSGGHIQKGVCK